MLGGGPFAPRRPANPGGTGALQDHSSESRSR